MSVLILQVDEVMRTLSNDGQYPFVVNDKTVDIVRFALNTGFTDVVLDGQTALRVMYQRPGETEVRAQTLTYYDTDGLHNYYDWQLLSADLAKKGTLTVALCILRTDGDVEEWHTTPCQVRVLGTIHTDDSDEADETITATVAQRVAVLETMIQRMASGAPTVVSSLSDMTDTDRLYVLTTDGHWYYYDGSAWIAGGEYGAVATDTTLTQAGIPADAKAVGDMFDAVEVALTGKADTADIPENLDTDAVDVDLDITDSNGNVIARFADGHIQTKNFDSSGVVASEDLASVAEDVETIQGKIAVFTETKLTNAEGVDLDLVDTNGNVILRLKDGHIKTSEFDSADIRLEGNIVTRIVPLSNADLDVTDSFGNVIARFSDGHFATKNFDSSEFEAEFADIPSTVETLSADVSNLKTATSGILYRTRHQTDGVYAACRYHQPNSSAKQFCLLLAADSHSDGTRLLHMIEYLNAIDALDACLVLGDISGNTFSDSIQYYTNAISGAEKPVLTVLGNHDVVGAASEAQIYAKYGDLLQYADLASGESVSGKYYYYKDFTAQKIRVIVLMQYDILTRAEDNGDLCFGQTQIDWFISTLNSTPSDYGVIIAEHTNPSSRMTYNMDEKYTSSTWHQSNSAPTLMVGNPIPDIVNAWINGGTLSQTYSYTFNNPPADLSVSVDFTSRGTGEFITYLGGHWHMDVLGTPTGYTNQPDYHAPATGLPAATQGDMPRKYGTTSEDSLCVMGVDRDKKTVKIFHIGAHYTKDAVDRQYFKYSYGM